MAKTNAELEALVADLQTRLAALEPAPPVRDDPAKSQMKFYRNVQTGDRVSAVQWAGIDPDQITLSMELDTFRAEGIYPSHVEKKRVSVPTKYGYIHVHPGEWVVLVGDRYTVMSSGDFNSTYKAL